MQPQMRAGSTAQSMALAVRGPPTFMPVIYLIKVWGARQRVSIGIRLPFNDRQQAQRRSKLLMLSRQAGRQGRQLMQRPGGCCCCSSSLSPRASPVRHAERAQQAQRTS